MYRRLALTLLCAIGLCGCPTPVQYGGDIPVDYEGLSARLGTFCRFGPSGDSPDSGLCPQAAKAPAVESRTPLKQTDVDGGTEFEPQDAGSGALL